MSTRESVTSIVIERRLSSPVGDVFAALTDPAAMAQWLSPTGVAEVSADVRVGGRFSVTMVSADMRIEHRGEYLVVDPPTRLSFTWVSQYTGPRAGVVTFTLAPRGSGTLLTLTHEGLPDDVVDSHRGGWQSMVERLAQLLSTGGSTTESEHGR